MPLGHSGYYIPAAWLVWLGFLGLVLLSAMYVQVLHWENHFQANRAQWLEQIRLSARQLRIARLRITQQQPIPSLNWGLLFGPFGRGLWGLVFWLLRSLWASNVARP